MSRLARFVSIGVLLAGSLAWASRAASADEPAQGTPNRRRAGSGGKTAGQTGTEPRTGRTPRSRPADLGHFVPAAFQYGPKQRLGHHPTLPGFRLPVGECPGGAGGAEAQRHHLPLLEPALRRLRGDVALRRASGRSRRLWLPGSAVPTGGCLALARVPAHYPARAGGLPHCGRPDRERKTLLPRGDRSFVEADFAGLLRPESSWKNERGETWSVERIVTEELKGCSRPCPRRCRPGFWP